ncbi:hypothetical protein [Nonomuraea typhae]|uniref:Leucine-rich repeat domain-containing protein n=1 Tax=Nonomuraea typhae TaxID=2603600 RepID=A0ABW7YPI8_9ACTN
MSNRSEHKIVGGMQLLHDEPSYGYAPGWNLGDQLARQRRWDLGVIDDPAEAWKADYTGEAVNAFLGRLAAPRPQVTQLTIRGIGSLDCAQLVQRFPQVTELYLHGRRGTLIDAAALNRLASLQTIRIVDLFGMTPSTRARRSRTSSTRSGSIGRSLVKVIPAERKLQTASPTVHPSSCG